MEKTATPLLRRILRDERGFFPVGLIGGAVALAKKGVSAVAKKVTTSKPPAQPPAQPNQPQGGYQPPVAGMAGPPATSSMQTATPFVVPTEQIRAEIRTAFREESDRAALKEELQAARSERLALQTQQGRQQQTVLVAGGFAALLLLGLVVTFARRG